MKSSWELGASLGNEFQEILHFDQLEIDRPDRHHRMRLHYMELIREVVSTVRRYFPEPERTKVGDFGCAQGNTSLILAESGYPVYAIDINPVYVEYSKRKHERGKIEWIVSSIEALELPSDFLDAAILGEIIIACAYPQKIVEKALRHVRPGGLLIITVPNGHRIRMPSPTLHQIVESGTQAELEQRQFGSETLFRLRPCDFEKFVMPPNATLLQYTYCGGTLLINRYSQRIIRLLPLAVVEWANRFASKVPLLNRVTSHNLCLVLQKR
ncbi:MAG: methyltransferase domain-containing protein [Acidobacteria bacterium]|nr:methyltransferase domain-containing protein [Acidobacteriota bacterium]